MTIAMTVEELQGCCGVVVTVLLLSPLLLLLLSSPPLLLSWKLLGSVTGHRASQRTRMRTLLMILKARGKNNAIIQWHEFTINIIFYLVSCIEFSTFI